MMGLGYGDLSIEEYLESRLKELGLSQEEIDQFKQIFKDQNQ